MYKQFLCYDVFVKRATDVHLTITEQNNQVMPTTDNSCITLACYVNKTQICRTGCMSHCFSRPLWYKN